MQFETFPGRHGHSCLLHPVSEALSLLNPEDMSLNRKGEQNETDKNEKKIN